MVNEISKIRNTMSLAQLQSILDSVYARLASANTFTNTTEATASTGSQIFNGGILVKKKIWSNSSINIEANPSSGDSSLMNNVSFKLTDSGNNTYTLSNDGTDMTLTVTGTALGFKTPQIKISNLTSGRVPIITTNGKLVDDADLTFSGDTLSATKLNSSSVAGLNSTTGNVLYATSTGLIQSENAFNYQPGSNALTVDNLIVNTQLQVLGASQAVPFNDFTGYLITNDNSGAFLYDQAGTLSIDTIDVTNTAYGAGGYKVGGVAGVSGSFTTVDLKTVTVTNGLITSIV